MLVERSMLDGALGAWPTRAPAALQIPATGQAIVAARIHRLAPAVVAGRIGDQQGRAAGVPEAATRRLAGASRFRAVRSRGQAFPEAEYTFKPAFTHEVTYRSLLQERRRGSHARNRVTAIGSRNAWSGSHIVSGTVRSETTFARARYALFPLWGP
jgi:hypothetical protein